MTTNLIADVIAPAVAGWLLTYAIHSTLLLGLAAVLAVRLREQHAWLDWFWKVALVGAVVTTTVQSGLRLEPVGGRWSAWPAVAEREPAPGEEVGGAEVGVQKAERATGALEAETVVQCCVDVADDRATSTRDDATSARSVLVQRAAAGRLRDSWPSLLIVVWSVIALFGVARFAQRQWQLQRVLRHRRPVQEAHLIDALRELSCASGLRGGLRLTVTPRCPVPLALWGGEIVVPERFLSELDAEQQRAALAHEVAHQMRRDPLWLLLVHMLEAVFFFQPLQRRARRALRAGAEVLCDDWAVRQTVSIGVARCLATVAAWVSPAREWQLTAASGMACSDSALLRRVDRVLRRDRVQPTRRAAAFATLFLLPVLLLVAPVVSNADIPVSATLLTRLPVSTPPASPVPPTAAARIAATQAAQEHVIRAARPTDPLEARWSWALEEAARRRLHAFYIVYSFYRPLTRHQQFISDSYGVNFSDELFRRAPLSALLDGANPIAGRGNIGAVFRFAGADDRRIDRIGHRSMSLGYDFDGDPVFWLGYAQEAESLGLLARLFDTIIDSELRGEVVEAYGIHPTTDRVLPFLTRALRPPMPEEIRAEAAESFEHHQDPRVVPLLAGAARTDPSPSVRAEAAEALGAIHVAGATPALVELAQRAGDARVRREAAEALGDQAPDRAVRALAQLIDRSDDPGVRIEAVEALGTVGTREAMDALVRIIWEHRSPDVQREAVETLGDFRSSSVVEHLEKVLIEHRNENVVLEALDVLGERNDARAEERIAQAALSSPSAHVRREALQWLGDAQESRGTGAGSRSAEELAALLERAIFQDRDRSVQLEAVDVAAESLPRALARRLLRQVAEQHPAQRVRAEAREQLEDIG